jgi:hypothetical protein
MSRCGFAGCRWNGAPDAACAAGISGGMEMTRKVATALVALALVIMAGAPAKADASQTGTGHTDLSSLPKIEAYLNSIGIDPGSVVVQQGKLNYAGPDCPGEGWNCTTANKVVQLAPANLPATNVVDCSPAVSVTLLGIDECVIVQSSVASLLETASTTNSASCDMDATGGDKQKQRCKITQHSNKGNNYAYVRVRTTQRGGSAQVATQEAEITQMSETGKNTAKVMQTIQQTLDTHQTGAVTQSQNARQSATVSQTSTSGDNSSDVRQAQVQNEIARTDGSITQQQNTDSSLGPNVEADITQESTTGNATSSLGQVITQDQDAYSAPGPVTQTEGNFSGGLDGTVMQTTNSPGVLRSTATQDEVQTQDADTTSVPTQTKIGPEFCCATQNGGTTANINTVTQSSVQTDNDVAGSSQFSNQSGHCISLAAECTVNQTYTANGETDTDSETGQVVSNNRFCSGGIEGGCSVD